jgi:cyclopropane fatty-acyl-phospholipid synthase-like methyltransferase
MNAMDPLELFFGDLDKLGPGDAAHTQHVLESLPRREFAVVVDAGCGSGQQTLTLARALHTPIHAIDSYPRFLENLARRAAAAGLTQWVQPHCMDMKDIASVFPSVDLLWSEGAAYNIGFEKALTLWHAVVAPGGFVVVSELCWLTNPEAAPAAVREFFHAGYPDMRTVDDAATVAKRAGYQLLGTHTLPRESWVDGYYDVLKPRAKSFLGHSDPAVHQFAADILNEIAVFEQSAGSYGYVFFVLSKP